MLYVVVFITGFLLSGIWFALNMLLSLKAKNSKQLLMFSPLLSAVVPAVMIWLLMGDHPFHFEKLADHKVWIAAAVTLAAVCTVVLAGPRNRKADTSAELAEICMEAACMEIPQRAMMQTFILWLLLKWNLNPLSCILINAFIWCGDIIFQAVVIQKQVSVKKLLFEILSSFLFSLGIGYVFHTARCIILPMALHAAERFITNYRRKTSAVGGSYED